MNFNYLLRKLRILLNPSINIDLIAIDNDYYLARFSAEEDYNFAKFEGPWMIIDHYLIVKSWEPNFDPQEDKTKKLLVWVHFPYLPIEYYYEQFLMKVGEKIGRPVMIE